jgi:predicted transcriptional regulator
MDTKLVSIRLDVGLLAKVDEIAASTAATKSAVITMLVTEAIARRGELIGRPTNISRQQQIAGYLKDGHTWRAPDEA